MPLTLFEANRVIDGVLSRARSPSLYVSASVCDPVGHLIAHQRMDGAFAESSWESMGKSMAAAQEGCPSGEALKKITRHPRTALLRAMGAPNLRRPGGLPIYRKGLLEGAIGVSGAPTNEQDNDLRSRGNRSSRSRVDQLAFGLRVLQIQLRDRHIQVRYVAASS